MIIKNKIIWKLVFIFVLLSILIKTYSYIGVYGDNEDLASRVLKYYEFEKSRDWSNAYDLRTPKYRMLVAEEYYMNKMSHHAKGWDVKEFSIKKISIDGTIGYVTVSIFESMPIAFANKMGLPAGFTEIESETNTIWHFLGGKWFCYDAGTRGYLPLNSAPY